MSVCFTYDELMQRDRVSLDIFRLKDDSLPPPKEIAADIVENLEAALEQFQGIEEGLGAKEPFQGGKMMATLRVTDIRALARSAIVRNFGVLRTASAALEDTVEAQRVAAQSYDIFLSHSFRDAELMLGVKAKLESHGYSVYVDWLEDPQLDRTKVTPSTAELLRSRMNGCKTLFYTTTPTSSESRWMPWECGYFDGRKNRTAILPLTEQAEATYTGVEYLGIYPYITEDVATGGSKPRLWVNKSADVYCTLEAWLSGKEPARVQRS